MKLKLCYARIALLWITLSNPLEALPLDYIWKYLDRAAQFQTKESYLFDNPSAPATFNRETIAFKMHSFCHSYYKNKLREQPSLYRNQIEELVWNFYLPQIRDLQFKKPIFTCQSSPIPTKKKTFVLFQLDTKQGFYPLEWKVVQGTETLEIRQALSNKEGIPDSITFFQKDRPNCIQRKNIDSNRSGRPDILHIYQNCKLTRIEEDYDEDGIKERICYFNSSEELVRCEGLGAKNQELALKYSQSNRSQYIQYLQRANQEYIAKFGLTPRHVCDNLLNIMKTEFDLGRYNQVLENYEMILGNPNCRKEKLDAQVFNAFTNLYKMKNYSQAADNYTEANQTYIEENGWDSVELSLGLAQASLQNNQPKRCIKALDRIKSRILSNEGSFMVHYYLGSCYLENQDYKEAFEQLKRSQAFAEENEHMAQSYLKLGILFSHLKDGKKQSDEYFQSALDLNPKHENFVREFKKTKTFLAE